MVDNAIEIKSKAVFKSPTSSQEMDTYFWKSRRPNKKKEISKPHKEKKAKSANSQLTTSAESNTQLSGLKPWKTRGNHWDQQCDQVAAGIPAIRVNLIDITGNNNFGGN